MSVDKVDSTSIDLETTVTLTIVTVINVRLVSHSNMRTWKNAAHVGSYRPTCCFIYTRQYK